MGCRFSDMRVFAWEAEGPGVRTAGSRNAVSWWNPGDGVCLGLQTSTIQAALGADLFLGGESLLLPSGNAHAHTLIPGGSLGALSKFQPLSSAGECCVRRLPGRWHGPQSKRSVEGELPAQVPWG